MKILLVDDHQLFADGLKGILRTSSLEADVEAVNNGRDGLQKILSGIFDVALIDLRLPIMDGFTLLEELNERNNLTPVVVVSASRDPGDMQRAMDLGAMSFIPKSSSGEKIVQVINSVLGGQVVYPGDNDPRTDRSFALESEKWAAQHNITPRQLEVLRLVRKGLSNQAIAEQLCLSVATVKSHVSAIFNALGAQSRSESSEKAHQLGLD
ncbi:MAG: LuxR family transcriptional regulator [Oleibacter sp.]|nr:LuxR family transcriptional regulator [Thalassolituus sp.]|tara:strand:- start:13 stop:642 length:630 start_codon:yes stop_codon:yes gene_type:complete